MKHLAIRSYYRDDHDLLPAWRWLNGYTQARVDRDRSEGLSTAIKRVVVEINGRAYVTEQIVRP